MKIYIYIYIYLYLYGYFTLDGAIEQAEGGRHVALFIPCDIDGSFAVVVVENDLKRTSR